MRAALALTWSYALVEALAGWRGGSLALLADAGHMVTDGAALGLAFLAAWAAAQPPSARHSYGFGRIELFAALINALAMLAVVFGIGFEAWSRFQVATPHRRRAGQRGGGSRPGRQSLRRLDARTWPGEP